MCLNIKPETGIHRYTQEIYTNEIKVTTSFKKIGN